MLRGDEVPAWGRTKLSPHQTGFNDVLALAQLGGRAPAHLTAIGVQPLVLDDFGGSLRPAVKARMMLKAFDINVLPMTADIERIVRALEQTLRDRLRQGKCVGLDGAQPDVEAVAAQVFIPLTVGGGIRTLEDIRRLLSAGCDGRKHRCQRFRRC